MEPLDPKAPINPASLLLPKKEGPPLAPRINAGALLAQEQAATLEPQPAQEKVLGSPVSAKPQEAGRPDHFPAQAAVPAPSPDAVHSLQTYQSDIEHVVQGGASIVSMAAAEANRRSTQQGIAEAVPAESGNWLKQGAYIVGGLVLLAAAGGVLALIATRDTTVPTPEAPQAPFISVDNIMLIDALAVPTRDALMTYLTAARQTSKLPLGLIEWLYVTHTGADGMPQGLRAADFLAALAPNVPASLLRTVQPNYLVGVHSFDENQAFILLQVDSYGLGYSAMLEWERTMAGDLSPLFSRNPSPRLQSHIVVADSTSSPQTSQQFIPTSFVDRVVENRDTRVLLNTQGDILLLWTFLGRNLVLITTNEYTLREVVSRINIAPSIPATGQ